MKHVNIPIFIPHLGCPNDCVFCNQRRISGKTDFDISSVEDEILRAVQTVDYETSDVEIAFFGGSFTGIDRGDMLYLLSLAKKYVDMGKARSVRLSTRPDYINGEILDILAAHSVTDIELGLQSMDDEVLAVSKRGHTSEQARIACRMIKSRGFGLVGQMMIGLPGSDVEKEINTAREIVALGCDAVRIYPTVVFCETELADMMDRGEYAPLDTESAVERSAAALEVFVDAGIPVIRLGLQSSDNLLDGEIAVAGAYHSAIGEMVQSRLYLKRICEGLNALPDTGRTEGALRIFVPAGEVSKASGQKKYNKQVLSREYGFRDIRIIEDPSLTVYSVRLEFIGKGENKICT